MASTTRALNPTKNDLPEATRGKVIALLEPALAEALDLGLTLKHAHWNVKGANFIALHKLFDEIYEELEELTDSLAERIVMLGGRADGGAQFISTQSTLPDFPSGLTRGEDFAEAVASSLAAAARGMRAGIDAASELGDQATADLFTEVVRFLDKQLWFVEAHLQEA